MMFIELWLQPRNQACLQRAELIFGQPRFLADQQRIHAHVLSASKAMVACHVPCRKIESFADVVDLSRSIFDASKAIKSSALPRP